MSVSILDKEAGFDLSIHPIAGHVGAEIRGVKLSGSLPPGVHDSIRRVLLHRKVVIFRDQQRLDDEAHERFARANGGGASLRPEPVRAAHAMTVSLDHPDATAALIGGRAGITAHFSNPPFQQEELTQAGIHQVLSSYETLGGPHSSAMLYATSHFRDANPHWVSAVIAALESADAFIAANPREAAELYFKSQKSKLSADFTEQLLRDLRNHFTTEPQGIMAFAKFQPHTGQIASVAADWHDVFFPELTAKTAS